VRTAVAPLAAVLALAACGEHRPVPAATTTEGYPVLRIPLRWSNAYLIRAPRPILIDAGSPGDLPALESALASQGLRVENLALAVLTHGHADHAGLGAALRRAGVSVVLGAGDAGMAASGRNDDLVPTGLLARVLKWLVPGGYEPFAPDLVVDAPLDLGPWGLAGRVLPFPGHTPGSLALLLDNGVAFAGDMALGGFFGGALLPARPGEHYFQPDPAANRRNLGALLAAGAVTLCLGHGGPVAASRVATSFGLPLR
jgi:glyoxylase-like metal-dependent hydrolase (beta-lactamase superfamily II)